jgi:hypothetical protein
MYNEFKILIDNDEEQNKQKKRKNKDTEEKITVKKKPKVTQKTNLMVNYFIF